MNRKLIVRDKEVARLREKREAFRKLDGERICLENERLAQEQRCSSFLRCCLTFPKQLACRLVLGSIQCSRRRWPLIMLEPSGTLVVLKVLTFPWWMCPCTLRRTTQQRLIWMYRCVLLPLILPLLPYRCGPLRSQRALSSLTSRSSPLTLPWPTLHGVFAPEDIAEGHGRVL